MFTVRKPDDDPRVSDEATGLPPLHELEDDNAMVVVAWDASDGLTAIRADDKIGEPVPVRWLHVRGLARDGDNDVSWVQMHIAVPVGSAVEVAAALAKGTTANLDEEDGP
jgi:hypothetical protein